MADQKADQKMDVTHRRDYEFTKHVFGDAVYVAVKQENFTATIIGTGHNPEVHRTGTTTKTWGVCVNKETYEKHGGLKDPSWVLAAGEDEEYVAVTQEYYDAYKKDQHHRWGYDDKRPMKQDVLETLKAGQFHLIVRTGESVMYTLKGEPVARRISIDYISGNLRGGRYYMKKLAAYLKEHPQCEDVNREGIPYYNAEFPGETAVEFYYVPKDDAEFKELMSVTDSFNRMDAIRERLGVAQFERGKKKRETEED